MPDEGASVGATARTGDTHIRTFLIADVRGYTVFTQEHGDEAAARLAAKFAAVARGTVEAHGGTVVELRGDEALAVFDSARQAIRASIELQRRLVDETVADPGLPLAVGIGLDAGEAVAVGDGFRGGALNLAARLCSIAAPAEVLASQAITHLARKVPGVAYVERGAVRLKGLADPVHVIRLRAEADDPADDVAFRRALGSAAARLTPVVPGETASNPYKGLRAFEEGDAQDFFGREELLEQLVARLAETRFLAVVGPSGSGKSSVVRAGLVPAVRGGAIPGSEHWRIADMFPGARPLDGLEAALLRSSPDPPDRLIDQLERDEHGLHRAILRLLPTDGTELLLVIDQFEEVFTLVEDEEARAHFLASIEAAATDPRSRLRVVATLRADFYDRPLRYRGFAELFKSRVEALVPLSPEELERAISGPAKRVDVSLEPGLVAAMLGDVSEEPGALPLMEYALTELFDRREGRMLTLASYRDVGGVSGALGRRAEELYEGLDDEAKEAARQLFLRLVTLGEGAEDTRRRATRAEIASLDVDEKAMSSAIDAFGVARLISFDRDSATGEPTIDLAHEAILTAWDRLHRWLDASREDLRTERRLATAAREWTEADRDPSFLLAGSRLEQAEVWRTESGVAPTPDELEYIEASRADRDRMEAVERARTEHERDLERRSVQRLRTTVAVLTAAALVAGGLTVFATTQRERAETEERTAFARELAAASVANLDVDPERSILLALEAIDQTRASNGSVLPEAEEALHRAVTASRIVLTEPNLGGNLDWSPGGVFVTEGPEDEGLIDIRDAATGERIRSWTGHEIDINDVRFSPDGSMLATAGDDGALTVWDPETGERISSSSREAQPVVGQSFDQDGSLVAASWPEEGIVQVLDASTGRVIRSITGVDTLPADTALSPDGDLLAVGMFLADHATVYEVATGDVAFELPRHRYSVNSVSWSPDGRWIATGAGDGAVRVWDARTGELDAELIGHTGVVITVDWASDSERLVSAGSDGTARVWQIEGSERREVFRLSAQQTRSGTFAAFSPAGTHVITGDVGIQAIKIWDVRPLGGAEVLNLPSDPLAPVDVAYLPDGRIVASHDHGSVTIWDERGDPVSTIGPGAGSGDPVVHIAVNPDGTRVATVRNFSNLVTVWDASTGAEVFSHPAPPASFGEISSLGWTAEGEHLVASSYDGSAAVLDGRGEVAEILDAGEGTAIEGVAFSPDGRLVAAAVSFGARPLASRVMVWDWERGEVVARLDVLGPTVVSFDPAGSTLAVGRFDGTVEIWDMGTRERVHRIAAHSGSVWVVAYSPDGSRIATGGEDATARLFDAETGDQQLVLRGHTYLISGLSFSPDGRRLATVGPDGVVRVWALDLDELIALAREHLTRELSDDECRQYLHKPARCS